MDFVPTVITFSANFDNIYIFSYRSHNADVGCKQSNIIAMDLVSCKGLHTGLELRPLSF